MASKIAKELKNRLPVIDEDRMLSASTYEHGETSTATNRGMVEHFEDCPEKSPEKKEKMPEHMQQAWQAFKI